MVYEVIARYPVLVYVFGPHQDGDPDKVLAEWQLETPFGWAEVYDYKSPVETPEEVTNWHVQAANEQAWEWVAEQIDAGSKYFRVAGESTEAG